MRQAPLLLLAVLVCAGCGARAMAQGPAASDPTTPISAPATSGGASGPTWVDVQRSDGRATAVSPTHLTARIVSGQAVATVRWWGGLTACSWLQPVAVHRMGHTITLAVREAPAPGGLACAEIAVEKAARIDLSPLEPGRYRVIAGDQRASLIVS